MKSASGRPRQSASASRNATAASAGLASLARHGADGLASAGREELHGSLRHGQLLAAWNCGFEGARGALFCGEGRAEEVKQRWLTGHERLVIGPGRRSSEHHPTIIRGDVSGTNQERITPLRIGGATRRGSPQRPAAGGTFIRGSTGHAYNPYTRAAGGQIARPCGSPGPPARTPSHSRMILQ